MGTDRADQTSWHDGPLVVVAAAGQTAALAEGETLSFGRATGCDLRVGVQPGGIEDLGVSRRAGTISHAEGRVWVRNDSTTQPLYLHPDRRGELVLESRGEMISLPNGRIDIVMKGRIFTYTVAVAVEGRQGKDPYTAPRTSSPATLSALTLTDRERRLLAALCEPLIVREGAQGRPASYREAASRLGLSEHTVRNGLDALRARLAAVGVPDVEGAEAKDSLARYAVRSATITVIDVDALSRDRTR